MESKNITYTKNPEIVEKENEGKLLLFNVNSGVMFELNESANILWTKSNDEFNVKELNMIMKESFQESSNLEKDIVEYIQIALDNNLILSEVESNE